MQQLFLMVNVLIWTFLYRNTTILHDLTLPRERKPLSWEHLNEQNKFKFFSSRKGSVGFQVALHAKMANCNV